MKNIAMQGRCVLASVLRFFYKLIMLPRFDIHTHAFHPKIADKVVKQLENHYRIPPVGNGCYEDLAPRLARAGIRYCCIHSAAPKGDQVIPANRWAVSLREHEGVIPFGTMHPDFADMESELAFLWDNGIRGLKLHPDFQGFRLDDPRLMKLYAAAEGHFTMMFHVGDLPHPAMNPSCPYKVAALKRQFPKLRIIAAHFGGYRRWDDARLYKGLKNVYFDTCSSLAFISAEKAKELIIMGFIDRFREELPMEYAVELNHLLKNYF
jgi:hypothetical protein